MNKLCKTAPYLIFLLFVRLVEKEYHLQPNTFHWQNTADLEQKRVAADYERQKNWEKSILIDNFLDQVIEDNSRVIVENREANNQCDCALPKYECVPRGYWIPRLLKVSERAKLGIFLVQKSFSSVLSSVVCYLERSEQFESDNRHFVYEFGNVTLCGEKNNFLGITQLQRDMGLRIRDLHGWKFLMMSRNPTERFVSGFLDQCVRWGFCLGCDRNLKCFMEAVYQRMIRFMEDPVNNPISHSDIHFFPQNWRCDLENWAHLIEFVKYSADSGETAQNIDRVLRKFGVDEPRLKFIYKEITGNKTVHSTKDSKTQHFLLRLIQDNVYLQQLLVKMFYHDYLIFDYDFPFTK